MSSRAPRMRRSAPGSRPGVERLRSAPVIPAHVTVSGHVYDFITGLVDTVLRAVGREARGASRMSPRCGTNAESGG